MDYNPTNIAPAGTAQGYYYTPTIGPYDYWAIEYGYKEISGSESEELGKIAARGAEPALQYATDEDVFLGSDPRVNLFDLGHNPIDFTSRQMKLSTELMPKLLERAVKKGEGYQKARQAFNKLFQEYWRTAQYAAKFPGGVLVNRDHDGDPNQRPPFTAVDVKQQRDAMKLLAEHVFSAPKYDPKLLNYLPASHWLHWGMVFPSRLDYPIYETVATMQEFILFELLNVRTLDRLHDNELKVVGDADRYTVAEHLRMLVEPVFAEWKEAKVGKYTDSAPYISGFRRNLQRTVIKDLAFLVQESFSGPEDIRTLARMHLQTLETQAGALLSGTNKDFHLDDYTRAHLIDSQKRIHQVLNAQLQIQSVD
jgi:Met-zincin